MDVESKRTEYKSLAFSKKDEQEAKCLSAVDTRGDARKGKKHRRGECRAWRS